MDHSPFLFEPSDIQDPWSPGPFSILQLCPPTPIQFPMIHACELGICFLNMSFNALGPLLMLFPLSEVPFPSVQISCPTFWTLILTMQPSSSRVKLIPVIPNCPVFTSPSLTASRLSSRETLLLHSQSIQIDSLTLSFKGMGIGPKPSQSELWPVLDQCDWLRDGHMFQAWPIRALTHCWPSWLVQEWIWDPTWTVRVNPVAPVEILVRALWDYGDAEADAKLFLLMLLPKSVRMPCLLICHINGGVASQMAAAIICCLRTLTTRRSLLPLCMFSCRPQLYKGVSLPHPPRANLTESLSHAHQCQAPSTLLSFKSDMILWGRHQSVFPFYRASNWGSERVSPLPLLSRAEVLNPIPGRTSVNC